jgi:hypothetical protein
MLSRTRPQTGLCPKARTHNRTPRGSKAFEEVGRGEASVRKRSLLSGTPGRSVANARSGRTSDKGYRWRYGWCAKHDPAQRGSPSQAGKNTPRRSAIAAIAEVI